MAEPTLLLLHGLGATPGVWADLREAIDWPGRILAPSLAGHGDATWTGDYTVGALAAQVSTWCENGEEVVAVGHSLGGGVALALASGLFRPVVRGVVAVGVKVSWSDADVDGMAGVAARGIRWCETRDEAVTRFLRNAGLVDLVAADHPALTDAVVEDTQGWRVAQDPATFAQRKLDMAALVSAAQCRIVLGAGTDDAMAPRADLEAYSDDVRIADGAGHNVQLERPQWVVDLVQEIVA